MLKKYKTALFISTLLNMFLLGVVVPSIFMEKPYYKKPSIQGAFLNLEKSKNALSPESQKIVDNILAQQGENMHVHMNELHMLMQQAKAILVAPHLNVNQLKIIHEKLDSQNIESKRSISNMIVKIATSLSDKSRVQFFKEALSNRPPPPPPPLHHHHLNKKAPLK